MHKRKSILVFTFVAFVFLGASAYGETDWVERTIPGEEPWPHPEKDYGKTNSRRGAYDRDADGEFHYHHRARIIFQYKDSKVFWCRNCGGEHDDPHVSPIEISAVRLRQVLEQEAKTSANLAYKGARVTWTNESGKKHDLDLVIENVKIPLDGYHLEYCKAGEILLKVYWQLVVYEEMKHYEHKSRITFRERRTNWEVIGMTNSIEKLSWQKITNPACCRKDAE